MNAARSRSILYLLSGVAVVSFFMAGWQAYGQSRRHLDTVARETERCRELAAAINRIHVNADPVEPTDVSEDQIYRRVHQAAQSAGFDDQSVVHGIHPQPARTAHDAAYLEKDVELSLQGLTLEQFVRFLHSLCASDPKLRISAITLHDPKGVDTSTLWNVDPLTVTYRTHLNTPHP